MKNILITGGNGQLGSAFALLTKSYSAYNFVFTDVENLDICNATAVDAFFVQHAIDIIINCAAYTAVDKAETDTETARMINVTGVEILAETAAKYHCLLIHISTDYVFDGKSYMPMVEDDITEPESFYGETKLLGEKAVQVCTQNYLIIRTSWLYSQFGNNFVKTMLKLGRERSELGVIFDQVGTPTFAPDLADAVMQIIDNTNNGVCVQIPGIYHYSNEGVTSWYDFALEIMRLANLDCKIIPIETKDYPTAAKRPHYSILNKSKIKSVYKIEIPHWKYSLETCIKELRP